MFWFTNQWGLLDQHHCMLDNQVYNVGNIYCQDGIYPLLKIKYSLENVTRNDYWELHSLANKEFVDMFGNPRVVNDTQGIIRCIYQLGMIVIYKSYIPMINMNIGW